MMTAKKTDTTPTLMKSNQARLDKSVKRLVKHYIAAIQKHDTIDCAHAGLIARVECELIRQALIQTDNNQSHAARILGISRTTLRKKMKEHTLFDNKTSK